MEGCHCHMLGDIASEGVSRSNIGRQAWNEGMIRRTYDGHISHRFTGARFGRRRRIQRGDEAGDDDDDPVG